jgi:hypothetical protein
VGEAARLLDACAAARSAERRVAIWDREVSACAVVLTGATETGIGGWDISVACGARRPIPSRIAAVLTVSPVLVTQRPGLVCSPTGSAARPWHSPEPAT